MSSQSRSESRKINKNRNQKGKVNRRFFFETVRSRLFNGRLTQQQVDGMSAILDRWEKHHAREDDRWLAYMFATAYHETDKKMWPIEEYGKGKGKIYGDPDPETGKVYYGRGLVQLTWKRNYEKMSEILKVDLVNEPDLVLDLDISIRIMFYGMINGTFTGKRLGDYFNESKENWIQARRIINALDKANLIADHAKKFYSAISYTT